MSWNPPLPVAAVGEPGPRSLRGAGSGGSSARALSADPPENSSLSALDHTGNTAQGRIALWDKVDRVTI